MPVLRAHGPHTSQRLSWRTVLAGIVKWSTLGLVAFVVLFELLADEGGLVGHLNGVVLIALACISLAYLVFVSSRVHLSLPGIDWLLAGQDADRNGQGDAEVTLQVTRLSADAARVTVVNEAPVPLLRAETSLEIVREDDTTSTPGTVDEQHVRGGAFSVPARGSQLVTLTRVFDHVGIFYLRSAGVRVHGLLGILARGGMVPGRRRVRVVPNVYRLTYGVPNDRAAAQSGYGIPDTPADALDYDRVRDYRPGDPLKTIHWKLVAHGQGELYTKLFESSTITSASLVIDPYTSEAKTFSEVACHLYDTMLEGGFSLIEHARESGIRGRLRFVRRNGEYVEATWSGPAMLGWFVEMARRPLQSEEARIQSVQGIRLLAGSGAGYVIYATSGLCDESVRELIACHHSGTLLLVVHALPPASSPEGKEQRVFDKWLQGASIVVVALTSGSQIVRELIET